MFLNNYNSKYYDLLNIKIDWKKRNCLPNLHQRGDGFGLIFELLEKQNKKEYNIVETGTLRNVGNWRDGQSSILFQEFLKENGGLLQSVDISAEACAVSCEYLDSKYCKVTCNDSHQFLKTVDSSIVDLFFLDSYDVRWDNCDPSAAHHLEEFKIIESQLQPGTIIAIDDNTFYRGVRSGKGRDVYKYLKLKNIFPIYDEYIIIYQWD